MSAYCWVFGSVFQDLFLSRHILSVPSGTDLSVAPMAGFRRLFGVIGPRIDIGVVPHQTGMEPLCQSIAIPPETSSTGTKTPG